MSYDNEDDIIETDDWFVDTTTGEMRPKDGTETPLLTVPAENKGIRFSVSLIKTYIDCPAHAYARITKQPERKSLALVNGIAVHEAVEDYIKHRNDPIKSFRATFRAEAEKNSLSLVGDDYQKKYNEGETMMQNILANVLDYKGPDNIPFVDKIKPELCETFFNLTRNGRLWCGKVDLKHPEANGSNVILDWKTNKTVPGKYELDNDLQFSLYAWAEHQLTGNWPSRLVWLHARGKNISGSRIKSEKKFQYSFPTLRTPEQVEQAWTEVLEPYAKLIEDGVFPHPRGPSCTWGSYWNPAKQRCEVELPGVH